MCTKISVASSQTFPVSTLFRLALKENCRKISNGSEEIFDSSSGLQDIIVRLDDVFAFASSSATVGYFIPFNIAACFTLCSSTFVGKEG